MASPPSRAIRVSGSSPARKLGEPQPLAGAHQRQGALGRPDRRLPAGGVAVETQHRLVHQLPQFADLILGQRRSQAAPPRFRSRPGQERSRPCTLPPPPRRHDRAPPWPPGEGRTASGPFWKTGVSGEFKYLGCPSPRMRPPKPTTRPFRSAMGNISRPRKRSYDARAALLPGRITSPASTIRSSEMPSRPSAALRPERLSGAYPRRNRPIAAVLRRRDRANRRRPFRPRASAAFFRTSAAAASMTSCKDCRRRARSRSSGVSTGTRSPASAASRSTASRKLRPSACMTKSKTPPWAPQPKQ